MEIGKAEFNKTEFGLVPDYLTETKNAGLLEISVNISILPHELEAILGKLISKRLIRVQKNKRGYTRKIIYYTLTKKGKRHYGIFKGF